MLSGIVNDLARYLLKLLMRYPVRLAGVCMLAALLCGVVGAQVKLSPPLAGLSYPIKVEAGSLSGPGAEFLSREAGPAQFVLIGEPHGIAEVPMFAAALFARLRPAGFNYVAIETGPITARRIEDLAARPKGFADFNLKYPFGLPFYNWKEEAAFLEAVFRAGGGRRGSIWGLDQEFMASSVFHFERLDELARGPAAKNLVKPFRERASTEFEKIVKERDPKPAFLVWATSEDFNKLQSAFPASNSEATEILRELRESAEIYQLNQSGRGYESNLKRSNLMKRHFMAYYNRVKTTGPPKVIFKFGANHTRRGRNSTNVHDIGNFAAELAAANGSSSFHILLVPTGGTQNAFVPFGSPESDKARKFDPKRAFSFTTDVSELLNIADGEQMSIVDLRPLRPLIAARRISDLPDGFAELVWVYDVVVLMPNVKASTFFPWNTSAQ